ncbi:MAG: hypothetical protein PUD73_03100 [bacterium]|nr:hypothetical protein [bacterium]
MSRKIDDGKTAKQRYDEKFCKITIKIEPELADAIREKAYNERLSVNKFMIKCAETYLNSAMNKD